MEPNSLLPIPLAHVNEMLRCLKEKGKQAGSPALGIIVIPARDLDMRRDPRCERGIIPSEGISTMSIILYPAAQHSCDQRLLGAEG